MTSPNEDRLHSLASGSSLEMVDLDFAKQRLGGDERLLSEIISIFLEDAPQLKRELSKSISEASAVDTSDRAHALKGLMLNFGDSRAVQVIQEIEDAAAEDAMDRVATLWVKFEPQFDKLTSELRTLAGADTSR